jgi:hypothetical protein
MIMRHHRLRMLPVRISRSPMMTGISTFSAAIVLSRAFSSLRSAIREGN